VPHGMLPPAFKCTGRKENVGVPVLDAIQHAGAAGVVEDAGVKDLPIHRMEDVATAVCSGAQGFNRRQARP